MLEKLNAVPLIHPAATAQRLLCAFELYKNLQILRSRLKGLDPCVKSPNWSNILIGLSYPKQHRRWLLSPQRAKADFEGITLNFFSCFAFPPLLCAMTSDSSIRSTTIFGHRSDCCSLDQWCGKGSAGSTQTSPILGPGQRLNSNQALKARALSLRPSHTFQQPQCFWAPVTASWSSEAAV